MHKRIAKILVLLVISLFVISYIPQMGKITSATPSNDPVAEPMHTMQALGLTDPPSSSFSPSEIKSAYGLPSSGGVGATIAIIDAGDYSGINSDLAAFSSYYGLPAPTDSNFEVHKMSSSMTTASDNWPTEISLDVEWAHAIAPDAKILLVESQNNTYTSLLSAVDYATNRSDVVAVSMSWGNPEWGNILSYDSHFVSNHEVTFFASSGDGGAQVCLPACSPYVVAVGGTVLNLNADGSVNSEVAWSGSGGGVSSLEAKPAYQTDFGTPYVNRAVPDVSYNAVSFAIYCGSWGSVSGTSAGAPQWAAIQALSGTVTDSNLYGKAKSAYTSYFRDITTGSNGNPAAEGYDLVTGLGSPRMDNFGANLTVTPTSGTAGGLITLNGAGFTAGSSVNISYLNSLNSAWIPIVNNYATASTDFAYSLNAPDLLQNNMANDNSPLSDNIVFRAQDNSNSLNYTSAAPYAEFRRGITQVGSASATGVFGNNTDLTASAFVQNGQSVSIAGKWFNPGSAELIWDGTTSLGSATVDVTGLLNASLVVPTTAAGKHNLTISDAASNFTVSLTRLPSVANNYVSGWQTSDITVNLTPDYPVTETYYKINSGPTCSLTANGQPTITSEGNSNTLEYWSTWNIYGTGSMELPHVTIAGIQLQKTAPSGSMQINGGATTTTSSTVTLTITALDSLSGLSQMRFSNDGTWSQSAWEPYATSENWQLSGGDGAKTVYCQVQDNAGLTTTLNSSITLSNPAPTPDPTATATETPNPSPNPMATPEAPLEIIQVIIVLLALASFSLATKYRENRNQH